MKRIARHDIDQELARRVNETKVPGIESALASARTNPGLLNTLVDAALGGASL